MLWIGRLTCNTLSGIECYSSWVGMVVISLMMIWALPYFYCKLYEIDDTEMGDDTFYTKWGDIFSYTYH